jgi:hypothetical protein
MICVNCGYCCKKLSVVIVDDPSKGIIDDNLIFHSGSGDQCKHLIGDKPGEYKCAVHDMSWYKETPCFSHNSELFNDRECTLGSYIIQLYKDELNKETKCKK